MEVKPGYKQTEVGVIPDAWDTRPLGESVDLRSGHHVLARFCNTSGEGTPYITGPADFPNGKIQHSKYTTKPGTLCAPNDILVTVKGSGAGTIVIADSQYCISRQLMAVSVREWDRRFVFLVLQQHSSVFGAAATGLIPGLSRSDILGALIPLPPTKAEQEAIAGALSDADALIESLELLVAKKRQIKHGAMQQLLTGQKRLPGFSGEWETKTLGECGEVIMGQSPPGSTYNRTGAGSPLINGPTEFTERHPVKMQWTTEPARFCRNGDLLICVRGSSTGRTNYADDTYAIGRGVAAIRAKDRNSTEYLSYQVISGVSAILAAATGSTFPSVDGASFKKIVVRLPPPDEQRAIAESVSEMDAEIAGLEAKLAKARQVKQAMMQELLTGRIRLVGPHREGNP